MDEHDITPVLLCGGSGTRLWPLSRKTYPKQFVPLFGPESLFQAAARRVDAPGYASPLIVTASDFRFVVTEQLQEIGVDPGAILIEPAARNTAPAILAAALHLAAQGADRPMLVLPSDHAIPDAPAFRAAVAAGLPAARAGRIVTFGIAPDRPETGYGYLELSAPPVEGEATDLKRFVEKPDLARARAMLDDGNFLWNAGIFLLTPARMIEACRALAPDWFGDAQAAVSGAQADLGFLRLAAGPWDRLPDISVDYAVMEKSPDLAVVPFTAGWSDLGGWDAVWHESPRDGEGVATAGQATAIECRDSLLRSESGGPELVGIGLDHIFAIATKDAVLVAPMDRAQDVRKAVARLKSGGVPAAERAPIDHRPWGWFETLVLADRFQVKRITVHPGGALSLQSHFHRSEHWIVVSGTARVTVGDEVRLVTENQSIYIPLGMRHRLENPGKVPMVLIEVQTGVYLGEDDIVRHEDVYSRD